jgi:hypothetical protein
MLTDVFWANTVNGHPFHCVGAFSQRLASPHLRDDRLYADDTGIGSKLFALTDCRIQFGPTHEAAVQNSVLQRCRKLNWQPEVGMTGRERNNRRAYPHVLGTTLLQHCMRPPTRIEIASTSAERLEDHRLQPILCIGWRIAAPRYGIRLLDGNDPPWLRQSPKLSTRWREEETDMHEVE